MNFRKLAPYLQEFTPDNALYDNAALYPDTDFPAHALFKRENGFTGNTRLWLFVLTA